MLSKELYMLMKKLPCYPQSIPAEKLCTSSVGESKTIRMLEELEVTHREYLYQTSPDILNSNIGLTESGQAAIEEYESFDLSQRITRRALTVSIVAMIAAIISTLTAVITLIPQLPTLIAFIKSMVG